MKKKLALKIWTAVNFVLKYPPPPTDLLADYEEENRLAASLEQRIQELTVELEILIDIFTTTQQRLEQECYRTP